jgi:hypothetical protein
MPSETQPLLPPTGHSGQSDTRKFDPLGSSRHLLLNSWLNLLIVFVPLSFIGESQSQSQSISESESEIEIEIEIGAEMRAGLSHRRFASTSAVPALPLIVCCASCASRTLALPTTPELSAS